MEIPNEELLRVAIVLEEHQDWSLAENVYFHLLKRNHRVEEAFLGLGRVLRAQKKFNQAAQVLKQGYSRTKDPAIEKELGQAYENWLTDEPLSPAEKLTIATECLENVFSPAAVRHAVRLAAPLGKHLEVAQILEKQAQSESGLDPELVYVLSSLCIQGGDHVRARKWLDRLLEENPDHSGGKKLIQLISS